VAHWQKLLISALFLMFMLVFGYRQTLAPEIYTGSGLDLAELNRHVSVIAEKPHPIGSAANREVRDYIVAYFDSLGLRTELQKTTVVYRHPTRPPRATIIGFVENIIAYLPGRQGPGSDTADDLVVMGHYDSRPLTPGAGDDASATASIMEAARIMADGPAPVHDVIFLITDGEEMGLLGAQGFFRQHPAAQSVGLVLNFEARGSYGVASMFETSANNAWLIEGLIDSTPDLVASSLSYEIYRNMPNDTDMSISKGEGIPGLNFAFVAGLFDYHAMTDNPENLDVNTLAHQANNVLATAQHFANLETWEGAKGDLTYFNLWQGTLVSYSEGLAVALGLLVLVLGVWLFTTALRAGTVTPGSSGTGLLGVLIIFLVLYSLFDNLIVYLRQADAGITRLTSLGEWPLLAFFIFALGLIAWSGHRLERGLGKLHIIVPAAVLALVTFLAGHTSLSAFIPPLLLIPLIWLIRSRASRPDLWTAAICTWGLLTAAVLYFAPHASYLFIWPLASVLFGIVIQRNLLGISKGNARYLTLLTSAFIPLLMLTPVVILAYLALGLGLPQALMIFCTLSLLLIWPLVRGFGSAARGKAGLLIMIAGLAMMTVIVFARNFDARHPRPEELFYAVDVDQQQGFWVSPDVRPGSWLDKFMGAGASAANKSRIMPGYEQDILILDGDLPAFDAAGLTVNSGLTGDGMREIGFHIQSPGDAEYINLLFAADASVSSAMVNGFSVPVPGSGDNSDSERDSAVAEKWWRWRMYGLPREGADITITLAADVPLPVRIVEVDYGTPAGAPARPEDSMSKPYSWSDSMVIFQTVILK